MAAALAAMFAIAAVRSAIGAIGARSAHKAQEAETTLQVEQAKTEAAETAYARAQEFRRQTSMNVALAGMGVGGETGFRQTAAVSAENFFAEQSSLGKKQRYADIYGTATKAKSRANKFATTFGGAINAGTEAATLASQLGLFKK